MNHLKDELSPYLQQHKNNPVEWYPWCDEAFELAKQLNKPIFLSIGYSTCHWCHVMEKESFEDSEAAALLNDVFVCIKVDREERPDIDSVYMQVCQMLTGSGGWPLTVLMTPNKIPFFAGTYFPRNSHYGRIGVMELAENVRVLWKDNPEAIERSSNEIMSNLSEFSNKTTNSSIDETIFDIAFEQLRMIYDSRNGGFGHAPKFPVAHNLTFLLRYFNKSKNPIALEICENTLEHMCRGGIYDHIGFGFHRYSTDEQWLVPHFEKMLYDQALLIIAYTEAYQLTKNNLFKKIAKEVIEYVLRDMISPEGGFYSAEDADSEGEEGKFYIWTYNEIINLLNDPNIFIDAFGILPDGNYVEGFDGESSGKNIIHKLKTHSELVKLYNLSEDEIENYIKNAFKILFENRKERIPPFKDDKIITDWNSLMIVALAKAGSTFNESKYIAVAEKAEEFISQNLTIGSAKLIHRFRNGESSILGTLDDYAFLIWAELELYEATYNFKYLDKSNTLANSMIELFYDNSRGGFFLSSNIENELPLRTKELYDGAIPSGNSVALYNLIRLWKYYQTTEYKNVIDSTITYFSGTVTQMPQVYCQFLNALYFYITSSTEIIIINEDKDNNVNEIVELINQFYIPNKIVFLKTTDEIKLDFEFLNNYKKLNSKATVYVCSNFTCKKPTDDLKELEELLNDLI